MQRFSRLARLYPREHCLQMRLDWEKRLRLVSSFHKNGLNVNAAFWSFEEWSEDEQIFFAEADRITLEREIHELDEFAQLATSIDDNTKGKALLKALRVAFERTNEFGGEGEPLLVA
jgi:hypothetical protein